MTNKKNQENFLSLALESISLLLDEKDVQGMIIGGLAASILGRPRYTNDIDLVILDLDDCMPDFINKLKKLGIKPRISDAEEFALKSRVLLLQHKQSGIYIDISMGILPFERDAITRRQKVSFHGFDIFIPSPEDLIIFKSISQRPIDVEDIKAIMTRHPNLDKERILSTVLEFSDVLENKELFNIVNHLLSEKEPG